MTCYPSSAQKGFTLIELLVAITILGLLLKIGYPSFQSFLWKARASHFVNSMEPSKIYARELNQYFQTASFSGLSYSCTLNTTSYYCSASMNSPSAGKESVTVSGTWFPQRVTSSSYPAAFTGLSPSKTLSDFLSNIPTPPVYRQLPNQQDASWTVLIQKMDPADNSPTSHFVSVYFNAGQAPSSSSLGYSSAEFANYLMDPDSVPYPGLDYYYYTRGNGPFTLSLVSTCPSWRNYSVCNATSF